MSQFDPKYWSPFWKNPTITSFGKLFPKNYDESMLEFWRAQLDPRPSHVVDVACGNGAVVWLCDEILNAGDASTKITGVDLASISPFEVLRLDPRKFPDVEFIADTPAEQLPFADASVDLVVSQYGIEYSDLEKTVAEIGRVLSGEGRMAFILHHDNSVILTGATENLDDFRKVATDIALHEPLLDLCAMMDKHRKRDRLQGMPEYQDLVARINQLRYEVEFIVRKHMRKKQDTSVLTTYLQRLSEAAEETGGKKKVNRGGLVDAARDSLLQHIRRVEDLAAAALSAADRTRLIELVERQGFKVTINEALEYRSSGDMGLAFAARRAPA
ncbi:MAG: class I SAM-dependent methyltransferase [Gammaproteobacteria bacterium]